MKPTIAQQLENAYARASMAETAKHLHGTNDWQRVQNIQARSAEARQTEQESFRQDYSARVADARVAILKERGDRHYSHPAPQSATRQDRFDKDQIERQAHLRVHNAHHQTMAKIDVQENREVKQLMQQHQSPASPPQAVPSQQIKRER
jgi:hypothetical protein